MSCHILYINLVHCGSIKHWSSFYPFFHCGTPHKAVLFPSINCVSSKVLDRHWILQFIELLLPLFVRPTKPYLDWLVNSDWERSSPAADL